MTTLAKHCPICGKPRQPKFAPFCSDRCRDRDEALSRLMFEARDRGVLAGAGAGAGARAAAVEAAK